jgi:PHD/YefM family antitoxin component YafN of YafNO toxin-antitoxin module
MTLSALECPKTIRVNRSELRQKQRETLDRAKDNTVVLIAATDQEEEKLLLDKKYFDEIVSRLRSLGETLEITMNPRLFAQIMRSAADLEQQTRLGKLHSFEEAFGKE